MSGHKDAGGREEMPAARTTIVGGRPPGCGKGIGEIPRGIEVLVKKAAVDAEFKNLLLAKRAEAAQTIGLELDAAEVVMLNAVPELQLEAIIGRTKVSPRLRKVFLGRAAAVMLAALGAAVVGCERRPPTDGSRPDRPAGQGTTVNTLAEQQPQAPSGGGVPDDQAQPPEEMQPSAEEPPPGEPAPPSPSVVRGIRPDLP